MDNKIDYPWIGEVSLALSMDKFIINGQLKCKKALCMDIVR